MSGSPCNAGGLALWALHSGSGLPGRRVFEVFAGGIKQDLISYVGQLVLANVPVEVWVIKPHEHGLLDGTDNGM